jgi:hypothetical protein
MISDLFRNNMSDALDQQISNTDAATQAIKEQSAAIRQRMNEQNQNHADRKNSQLKGELDTVNSQLNEANRKLVESQREAIKYKREAAEAKHEVLAYKDLLCKPMAEIAEVSGNFKETYEKQMELMADWMVSQKAFKELAIQFGFEKGVSKDETIKIAQSKKQDVLNQRHDPENNTNADDFITKYASKK